MATKWIGSVHCLARVHCMSCLGVKQEFIDWREGQRNGGGAAIVKAGIDAAIVERCDYTTASDLLVDPRIADPWPEMFDIPEPVVCPYGVMPTQAYDEAVERAADNEILRDGPMLHRLTEQQQGEALVEMVAAQQLIEDVAVRIAEKLLEQTVTVTP